MNGAVTKFNGDSETNNLNAKEEIVDFSGKGLKLDTEADAQPIVNAIQAAKGLTGLILEGNTLGVEAAKAIAKALESKPTFQRALWKDAFTGRLKDEIPKALSFLGGGLILAKANLIELDLSDNALGPVGMEGLVQFLKSPVCYSLKCIRLNNNGLGIYGGRMLAQALNDCLKASKEAGSPLNLKTFIVGRNRLENEGAIALSEFFKAVGTLEEVQMPQNFIRHPGILALASALIHNPGLRILNFNDNTFTWRGSQAVAEALPKWQQLSVINFGDCLIRTKGAEFLAKALSSGHEHLKEVYMDHGEINLSGAKLLANSLKNKKMLKICDLNGNQLGEEGCQELKDIFSGLGEKVLLSLSDDEGEPSSEEEESEEEEESGDEDEEKTEEKEVEKSLDHVSAYDTLHQLNANLAQLTANEVIPSTVEALLAAPTLARFNGLGDQKSSLILQHVDRLIAAKPDALFAVYAEVIMKVSSTVNLRSEISSVENVQQSVDVILKAAFEKANSMDKTSVLDNTLLVYMGILKSEDKQFRPTWPLSGFFLILERILTVDPSNIPLSTLQSLQTFFTQPHPTFDIYKEESDRLKKILNKS
ncbi:hypothetical protein DAPPUDRAFT_307848 [Daphnia pulex]|uniref:Ran-GTPase activating protein 1 C-terminal domain-containing protein n=1 Tax=Daphnia pulex TaxID=6669 RepID=E9G1R0_DAPPU|nr:hypothetical protein DAPPUDRAFT_307848 [Daphnia pulex]|eukprot:EFX86541.1 hypothetical protein DAPPUDRAFT_307848 [Daphnia pulex]